MKIDLSEIFGLKLGPDGSVSKEESGRWLKWASWRYARNAGPYVILLVWLLTGPIYKAEPFAQAPLFLFAVCCTLIVFAVLRNSIIERRNRFRLNRQITF